MADSGRAREALGQRTAQAHRIPGPPPVIDGRLDDAVWCAAPSIGDLIQSSPNPGALATLPTQARVLFDDNAVYIGVRLNDPHADSIAAPYPRRDDENTSDWVFVEMDTRHDRRSGFSFGLNPRGVQVDGTWSDDVNYDAAWNGVWEGASAVDSAGWTAEYRIPFSQLALAAASPGAPLVWGLNIYRYSPHRGESSNWSPRLPSVAGIVSHFNALDGLTSPPGRSRLELLPYAAVTGTRRPGTTDAATATGGELRYRPSPSTSIALSVHPDFGQVEADPSQVNLTTFETFLPEQRPLFLESGQLFQFGAPLTFASRGTSFDQESPFYSRRIGMPSASAAEAPGVLGAFRLSGRTSNGWTGGFFDAWTGTTHANPLTSFSAGRVVRELNGGRAAVGMIATYTARPGMDALNGGLAARTAVAIGADARTRLGGDAWELTGSVLATDVSGSEGYLDELRHAPRHGYGRPDSVNEMPAPLPPAASLTGLAAQLGASRTSGAVQGGVAVRIVTQGFETNDIGFQRNADWLLVTANWHYFKYRPGHFIRRWSFGSDQIGAGWTLGGLRRAAVANLNGKVDFRNYWGFTLGLDREFPVDDPEVLRGGPALRLPPRSRISLGGYTDTRKRWQATFDAAAELEPATDSHDLSIAPGVAAFVSDRLQLGVSPVLAFAREGWQYVSTQPDADGVPHYFLGTLRQTTASLTTRATYAFSSHLTLQLYGQVFLSDGQYREFKEVVAPMAPGTADRVSAADPAGIGVAPDFADRELNINLLARWEFRPGSTLFLVWTHARSATAVAPFALGGDLRRLWRAPGVNALQAKISYWIGS